MSRMNSTYDFGFLSDAVHEGPSQSGEGQPAAQLRKSRAIREVQRDAESAHLVLPPELEALLAFTDGADLGDYRILTVREVREAIVLLRQTYGTDWREELIPFALLMGVGDYVLIDPSDAGAEGPAIIDGFHEQSPREWKVIRHGLLSWLMELSQHGFEPYWLG